MPYVPPEQRTPEWYIFDQLFWCRIPFNQSRSVEHIKHFGTPVCGDPERDRATANELVDRMITIDRMVEYHKAGVHVYVKNRTDCGKIYGYISDYLQAWKSVLEHSLNTGDAPLQDLYDLDQFANVVYQHAKYQFSNEWVESVLQRRMTSVLQVSRDNLFVKKAPEVKPDDTRTDEERLNAQYPERQSMGNIFAQRLTGSSLNRGVASTRPEGQNPPGSHVPGFASKWK